MKNKKVRIIVFAALLTAMAIVLKILGIKLTLLGGMIKDINLSPIIIIYGGMLLAPVTLESESADKKHRPFHIGVLLGTAIGAITDVIGYLVKPVGGYFPLFTLTNALMGLIPALFYVKKQNFSFLRVLIVTLITQTICSFVLNTVILIAFFALPAEVAWFRACSTFILAPIFAYVIYLLAKHTYTLIYPSLPIETEKS